MGPRLLEANLALDTQGKKDLAWLSSKDSQKGRGPVLKKTFGLSFLDFPNLTLWATGLNKESSTRKAGKKTLTYVIREVNRVRF